MNDSISNVLASRNLLVACACILATSCTRSASSDVPGDVVPDSAVAGDVPCQRKCEAYKCGQDGCGGYCMPCNTGIPESPYECDQHWTLCDEANRTCVRKEVICGPCGSGSTTCQRQTRFCPDGSTDSLVDCTNGWCRIRAYSFVAGAPEPGQSNDPYQGLDIYIRHPVVLTRAFEIMQTEVTQASWMDVMGTNVNPSIYAACGLDCPVSGVTFFDTLAYANRLSERAGYLPCYTLEGCSEAPDGYKLECARALFAGPDCTGYRLPSEAEFELAAGAGSTTCFPNGCAFGIDWACEIQDIAPMAWYCGNSGVDYAGCSHCSGIGGGPVKGAACCGPHPVGTREANPFGLHDMLGNVMEFTGTVFKDHTEDKLVIDPGYDPVIDAFVSTKGGAYSGGTTGVCAAFRGGTGLAYSYIKNAGNVGFRLVRTLAK